MAAMAAVPIARADAVRAFNRFYTRQIGVLGDHLLHGSFSLTEMRVFYELAQRHGTTAADVGRDLDLDAGYMSRIVKDFENKRLIERTSSPTDGRRSVLRLTPKGRGEFTRLQAQARTEIAL